MNTTVRTITATNVLAIHGLSDSGSLFEICIGSNPLRCNLGRLDCVVDAAEFPPPFVPDVVAPFEFIDLCQFFTKNR